MSTLNERIEQAIKAWQNVQAMQPAQVAEAASVAGVPEAQITPWTNVIYIGEEERQEIRSGRIEVPTQQGVWGMKVIPVALGSHLQVAYVEGAK